MPTTYIRASILHFLADPETTPLEQSYEYFADGLLIVDNGHITKAGDWQKLKSSIPNDSNITHYPDSLIMPGFIDTHIHYPQTDMIAAESGGQLLHWLNTYTFPTEIKFHDRSYAADVAEFFVSELLRNGTTTALVNGAANIQAAEELFAAAAKKHMRLAAGKFMSDINIPAPLKDEPAKSYDDVQTLIHAWHEKPGTRLSYAITLRFAPTTTPALFERVAQLKDENPQLIMQTHISENPQEIAWVKELFAVDNYLDIYDRYNLLGKNTVLAHGIYLTEAEIQRIAATDTRIAFCPTSNLYLGSGLFNYAKVKKAGIKIGLATDIGAGTSFSMLQTLNEAYKVLQLQQQNFSAFTGFYLATLGGASSLGLADKLGNFLPGKEADFVVLNFAGATPLLQRRLSYANSLSEKLFVLMMLGDDRSVKATYVNGELAHSNNFVVTA